jgi:Zn-dependent protease with chaperone function
VEPRIPLVWTGYYLDGQTAVRYRVTVAIQPDGLRIMREDAPPMWWRFVEIRQTQGAFRGEPVRLERGDTESPEAIIVDDEGFADALRRVTAASRGLRIAGRRAHWLLVSLAAGAAAVAVGLAGYLWGIPHLADTAAARMPAAWEERLGEVVLNHLAPPDARCADARRFEVLRGIVQTLAASAPPSPYTYRVYVVDDPLINAFAAPGGFIVMHHGLLKVTERPEELAGVLAHEISHVVARHGTRALARELSLRALISIATGDVSGLNQAIGAAGQLGTLRYRRADEEEADREGFAMLVAARIDPGGMISFLERLRRERPDLPRGFEYLSTHPATENRIAALRQRAATTRVAARPLLPGYRWADIVGICGGR